MGPYRGGQAAYLRVPFADFNCTKLPPGDEYETDFVLLADIFPTGYHGGRASACTLGRLPRDGHVLASWARCEGGEAPCVLRRQRRA
jgi:threonine dehydrogenase-like Zn-dependent dehydrogenase